jgi:hypothetical protein
MKRVPLVIGWPPCSTLPAVHTDHHADGSAPAPLRHAARCARAAHTAHGRASIRRAARTEHDGMAGGGGVDGSSEATKVGAAALVLSRIGEGNREREERLVGVSGQRSLRARVVLDQEAIEHVQPRDERRGLRIERSERRKQPHVQRVVEVGQHRRQLDEGHIGGRDRVVPRLARMMAPSTRT